MSKDGGALGVAKAKTIDIPTLRRMFVSEIPKHDRASGRVFGWTADDRIMCLKPRRPSGIRGFLFLRREPRGL